MSEKRKIWQQNSPNSQLKNSVNTELKRNEIGGQFDMPQSRRPQFRPRRDARSVNNKQGLAGWLAGWRAGWLAGLGCVDVDVAFGSGINKGWLAGWLAGWLGWL